MPLYDYKCKHCGCFKEIFQHKARPRRQVKCKCGKMMKRVFGNVNTDLVSRPRWSRSMGVNVPQIPEAMRLYPGSVYNEKGDLLIESRADKKIKMRKRGMVELE